jgi:hypothetical protein
VTATTAASTTVAATATATAPTTSTFFRLGTRYPGQAVRNQYGRRRQDRANCDCQ